MEKLDDETAAKFISALTKSVQTLCHGYLDFHNGIEIIGYINLNVDKGSSFHYVLEEKVCKNEENSTLFISNSFRAQNQKTDIKTKGKETSSVDSENQVVQRTNSTENGESGKMSSAISSISSALSRSYEKSGSASSSRETDPLHSKPVSNTAKRKASEDHSSDIRSAKSSHISSIPSPVSHFLSQSPHNPSGSSSPIDTKPSLSDLQCDMSSTDMSGMVLPQTAGVSGDSTGDLGVNLAGSVLERVDDHSNSDRDDSDGDLEVTFIKEEFVEGEQSACQFDKSIGLQYGRGAHHKVSSDNMQDTSLYPISLHHSASATFVPSTQDIASAQHYGPSTSSQPQPGTSGARGMQGQQGAPWHLRHTRRTGFRVDEASFSPPLAHHVHPTIAHQVAGLPVLDLSIKTEPRDSDYFFFNCEQRRKKNFVHPHLRGGAPAEEVRQKAKEKSKQYRQKQKVHRMADATYDMVFRHQVAERKRRQRMREKLNKLKLYGGSCSIAK